MPSDRSQPRHVQLARRRKDPDGRLPAPRAVLDATEDPVEDAHVVAIPRPQHLAGLGLRNQFTWKIFGGLVSRLPTVSQWSK